MTQPNKGEADGEEMFHDLWAADVDIDEIVVDLPSISTMPEIRAILARLGDVRGKRVLEMGCGFGEMSVYLAKQGANVTASDLSSGMLDVTRRLAAKHGAALDTLKCASDDTGLPDGTFDIVYCGNLLHHVNITSTMREVNRVLRGGGCLSLGTQSPTTRSSRSTGSWRRTSAPRTSTR
ncbi:MAG: class I SAM-dependent methyltransferase [Synergistaceae bacterium]|jgi:2-polyprenyl-3-methyl-5-hydroxy-6-metoxy-1,4-benzoquinol methylase|nr:class I SAM-dependent methyltransferase [Synergistaceae bacterium]